MPPQKINLLEDAEFHKLPFTARVKLLSEQDDDFRLLPTSAQNKLVTDYEAKLKPKPILSQGGKPSTISAPSAYEASLGDFTPRLPGGLTGNTYSLPSPRDIVAQAPSVGAAALTTLATGSPQAGAMARMGVAALGGVLGSQVQQVGDILNAAPPAPPTLGEKFLLGASKDSPASPAARMILSGATEGLFEIPGVLASKAGKAASKSLPSTAEEKIAESVDDTLSLGLKPGEIVAPQTRKEKILESLTESGKGDVLSTFGARDTPHEAGQLIYNANKNARKIAGDISRLNYEKLSGIQVNLQPHAQTILSIPPSLLPAELADKVKSIAELRANRFPPAMIKKAEAEAFGTVPFDTVRELRTAVREASELPPKDALMANARIGELRLANKELTGILDGAAKDAGKYDDWREATNFHKGIGDLFDRGLGSEINRTGLTDPQNIVSLISPNDMKAVRDMKAIFRYAEEGGDAAAIRQAKSAERKFQRAFLDQKVLDYPVTEWKSRIEKSAGRDVLAEILGNRDAEERLYAIATTAEKISVDSKIASDALAFAIMKTGKVPASFGTVKNLIKDVTIWASPTVKNTRRLVKALEFAAKPGTTNYARGVEVLGSLLAEMEKEKPPRLLQQPEEQAIPDFPMPPNPNPVPFRPGD